VPLLELRSVSKSFGGTPALQGVSLAIGPGERLGLIGENGAGKSTLIKILSGVHQADHGELLWEGESVRFENPLEAMRAGVSTIHQELAYFEKLTVAENLLLGEPWPRTRWGGTNWKALNETARGRLQACALDLEPATPFHRLSAAQRQEVAIARALARAAKLVILDEPSASLTEPEVARLFAHLERLRARGVALLYVSHRLDEILRLTDQVVVLRDGKLVAKYPTSEAAVARMVRDMVGREMRSLVPDSRVSIKNVPSGTAEDAVATRGPVVLRVEQLRLEPLFRDISFSVHAGEVVGLGGLIGAGRSEVARAIFGLHAGVQGKMELAGKPYAPRHPSDARERGVVYVPEERKRQGFVLEHSVRDGISVGFLKSIARFGVVSASDERNRVAGAISRFMIRAAGMNQPIGALSGGNQQKALLARWLETEPQLVILDEPTRGVDVGAKAEIHELIRALARKGKGVLLISSDLPELLTMSDRILVLRQGQLAAELQGGAATQEEVLLAASGLTGQPQAGIHVAKHTTPHRPKDLHGSGTTLS
jgi:rhamnose transport system ATP-binding protein